MEIFSLAIVLVFVLISVYALVKLVRFFLKEQPSYAYQVVLDEEGKPYDLVKDLNNDTKKKE